MTTKDREDLLYILETMLGIIKMDGKGKDTAIYAAELAVKELKKA